MHKVKSIRITKSLVKELGDLEPFQLERLTSENLVEQAYTLTEQSHTMHRFIKLIFIITK